MPDPAVEIKAPEPPSCPVDLSTYTNRGYSPGRGRVARALWYLVSLLLFESGWFPFSGPKAALLRAFGARIGVGVVVKPHVRIKHPWRLRIGDHCWIGQSVWIDNLAEVALQDHVCVSQGAYLCTGGHDHRTRTFDLIVRPITVATGGWIGARALVLGGVTVGTGAVVAAGSVVTRDVAPMRIVGGNPVRDLGERTARHAG